MTFVRPLALVALAVLLPVLPASGQDTTATAPTPVARVALGTPNLRVAVGDSIRLEARALDAAGRPIPEAKIVFRTVGPAQVAIGEDGWARAGSVGDVPMLATAIVPGTKPYIERLSLRVVPGPARRVEIDPVPARLVPRQRIQLAARVLSAEGDARGDAVTWTSSAPGVARVSRDGVLEARGRGPRDDPRRGCGKLRAEVRSRSRPRRRRRSRSSRRPRRCARATWSGSARRRTTPPTCRSPASRRPGRSAPAKARSTPTAPSSPTSRAPTA